MKMYADLAGNRKSHRIKSLWGNKVVIDHAYCGDDDDWKMPVLATRDIVIPKGARICQFRIQKEQPDFDFVEVDHLEGKNRNGFGASGVF